ncbi:STP1 protein [Plasmodium ovale wallikeri]|uniref:STP1 protein n=1 Tax=Plasmodium ovale wallikeri TaxID=864142 RepID=A0A1A9AGE6_PLAOA|nr:STP1 protein [Plasmodium ovale wallikeri]
MVSFSEFLNNSSFSCSSITKEHPRGHDPLGTYRRSKLDCEIYNPTSRSYPQIPVANGPTNKLKPPMEANIIRDSQGKNVKPVTYEDSTSAKTKPDGNMIPKAKPSATVPQLSSPSKAQPDDIPTAQDTPVKSKALDSSVNRNGGTKESTSMQGESPTNSPTTARDVVPPKDAKLTPSLQSVPPPNATTSLSSSLSTVQDTASGKTPVTSSILTVIPVSSPNSDSPSTSNIFAPAADAKGQDKASQSSTTSETLPTTHPIQSVPSTAPSDLSLPPLQVPVLNASPAVKTAKDPETSASTGASAITTTFTTTFTTTTATPATDTIPTISTMQNPISSPNQAPGILGIPQPPTEAAPSGTKVTSLATFPPHTPLPSTIPSKDKDTEEKSDADVSPISKGPIQGPGIKLPKNTNEASRHPSITSVTILDSTMQKNSHQIDQQINPIAVQQPSKISVVPSASDKSGASVTAPKVNIKTAPKDDSKVRTDKNDNTSIIPEGIPPLTHIMPTLLVILGTLTLLFQLYKYTPFGFLLGRRRKRKKRDLRRTFKIPEKPTYESPNIALHEWEDHNLLGQIVENDVYTKLLKINRYKQEMQRKKKKNKKTLIEVHMEVLEEYKNDEWELHKGDFLEICLRGFINKENETYQNFPYTKLTINNIKNEKTIEDIQKQEILWNNWIENHRNILEQWKKEEWFHILKNKWRNEEQKYKKKNNKLQENILSEQEKYSIVSQKDMWKQWISKQATLIDMFNKEDWFKSIVYAQDKEKNNYHINEYNNITVTNENQLKNEKRNHEYSRSKDIIQKLMVQIHMMVLEECIKEEIIRNKELSIDNFIEDIHNQNNYDEKRNMPQSDIDNFKVPEFEEIHTSTNK